MLYSKNVTVDGITVRNNRRGPGTDGIDIDPSSYARVQNYSSEIKF